jgi:DNA repair protein RadC
MSTWLSACVADVRTRLTPEDEGSLWVLFLDHPRGEVLIATAFDRVMDSIDAEMTRNLRHLIGKIPTASVLLVVPRGEGVPCKADLDLWQQLGQCCDTKVIDLVVVGHADYWSARRAAA